MGFFNSLVSVSKNKKTFKEWEQQDKDKKAQREVLAQKNLLDNETLDKASQKGKVIMDIVEIMDTHSENVAENVEESVIPFVQLATPIVGIGGTLLGCKIIKPITETSIKAASNFTKDNPKLKEIYEKLMELSNKNQDLNSDIAQLKLGRTWSELSLLNKKRLKTLRNSNDTNIKQYLPEIEKLAKEYSEIPAIKNMPKKIAGIVGGLAAIVVGTFIGANILGAKLQVKSSRIARWQSRQDLSDPKYFVQYTPEQVAIAKENLEQRKAQEEANKKPSLLSFKGNLKGGLNKREGFFKTINDVRKDSKNYDAWKENYNPEDKKVTRNLSEQELIEAKKEQEVIQRITKQINNNAEDYGENMEVASGVLIGGTPFLGAGVGFGLNKISELLKIKEKVNKKSLEKLLNQLEPEDATKLQEMLKNLTKTVIRDGKEVSQLDLKYLITNSDEFSNIISKNIKGNSTFEKIFKNLGKLNNAALSTKKGYATILTVVGSLITGIAGSIIGLKLQKAASRAGRFKAKQEISQNPQNFIGYTQEEYDSVKNVKAQKEGIFKKLGNYLMFVPNCVKDYIEYEKYRKNVANQEKELLDELVKLDVTDEQLKEAKELQRKVFTTFESVDDKSQEYSESMETMNEMSKPLIPVIGMSLAAAPAVIGTIVAFKKGGAYVAEKITGFFAKHTKLLKGKFATNYSNDVASNISKIVKETVPRTNAEKVDLSSIISNPEIRKIFSELKDTNIDNIFEKLEKVLPNEISQTYLGIFKNAYQTVGKEGTIKDFIKEIISNLQKSGIDIPTEIINKYVSEYISKLPMEADAVNEVLQKYQHLLNENTLISEAILKLLDDEKISQHLDKKLADLKPNLSEYVPKIKNTAKKGANIADKAAKGAIASGSWKKGCKLLINNQKVPKSLRSFANMLINSNMSDDQALKIYNNIITIAKNLPAEQTDAIFKVIQKEYKENPEKLMQAIKDGKLKSALLTQDLGITAGVASSVWSAISMLAAFGLESVFANMQKQAGRLGVMEGLNELNSPEYYANMEEKEAPVAIQKDTLTSFKADNTMSPMLKKYLNR